MTTTTTKTTAEVQLDGRDAHLNSAEDHMNNSTLAPTSDNRSGASLKMLRESHGIGIEQVAALAGTGINYLMRVEAGLLTPANTYIARVTYAICRLMKAPTPPCVKIGCLGIHDRDSDDPEDQGWHTAYEVKGDEWEVSVDWFYDDPRWIVYGRMEDGCDSLTEDKVEGFYAAWSQAKACAQTLNRSGYVNEVR